MTLTECEASRWLHLPMQSRDGGHADATASGPTNDDRGRLPFYHERNDSETKEKKQCEVSIPGSSSATSISSRLFDPGRDAFILHSR